MLELERARSSLVAMGSVPDVTEVQRFKNVEFSDQSHIRGGCGDGSMVTEKSRWSCSNIYLWPLFVRFGDLEKIWGLISITRRVFPRSPFYLKQ